VGLEEFLAEEPVVAHELIDEELLAHLFDVVAQRVASELLRVGRRGDEVAVFVGPDHLEELEALSSAHWSDVQRDVPERGLEAVELLEAPVVEGEGGRL
jgi:hypothetical protein